VIIIGKVIGTNRKKGNGSCTDTTENGCYYDNELSGRAWPRKKEGKTEDRMKV
jgi:hypothetical protein